MRQNILTRLSCMACKKERLKMTETPAEQAKQHGERAEKHAGEARDKLEHLEQEVEEVTRQAVAGAVLASDGPAYAARWQTTLMAVQAYATLALSERVAAVAGLLQGLVTPGAVEGDTGPLSGLDDSGPGIEWQYRCGPNSGPRNTFPWLIADREDAAHELAGPAGAVRSRVVGVWHERPAR